MSRPRPIRVELAAYDGVSLQDLSDPSKRFDWRRPIRITSGAQSRTTAASCPFVVAP